MAGSVPAIGTERSAAGYFFFAVRVAVRRDAAFFAVVLRATAFFDVDFFFVAFFTVVVFAARRSARSTFPSHASAAASALRLPPCVASPKNAR